MFNILLSLLWKFNSYSYYFILVLNVKALILVMCVYAYVVIMVYYIWHKQRHIPWLYSPWRGLASYKTLLYSALSSDLLPHSLTRMFLRSASTSPHLCIAVSLPLLLCPVAFWNFGTSIHLQGLQGLLLAQTTLCFNIFGSFWKRLVGTSSNSVPFEIENIETFLRYRRRYLNLVSNPRNWKNSNEISRKFSISRHHYFACST